jgi:acetate kinase
MAIGGPAGSAAMMAACLAQLGVIVYTAGVAENSSPKRCLVLKWRPGMVVVIPETYRDSRCV